MFLECWVLVYTKKTTTKNKETFDKFDKLLMVEEIFCDWETFPWLKNFSTFKKQVFVPLWKDFVKIHQKFPFVSVYVCVCAQLHHVWETFYYVGNTFYHFRNFSSVEKLFYASESFPHLRNFSMLLALFHASETFQRLRNISIVTFSRFWGFFKTYQNFSMADCHFQVYETVSQLRGFSP